MTDGDSLKDMLLKHSLASFQEEYKDINDSWKLMDSKAQSAGTIAGVFLAAAFALARQLPTYFNLWQIYLLCIGVGLLIFTVCLALAGMHIRRIPPPPIGENLRGLIDDLIANIPDAEKDARMTAFTNDQISLWQETNKNMKKKVNGKAACVSISQYCLFASIFSMTAVTIASVLPK